MLNIRQIRIQHTEIMWKQVDEKFYTEMPSKVEKCDLFFR